MPGVDAVDGHVDDRADAVAVVVFDAELLHELGVACSDAVAVNGRRDAVAADLFDTCNAAAVNGLAVGLLQALADGVRGGAFGQCGIFQHLIGVQLVVMDGRDLKHALRQSAGLVEHDDLRRGKGFQIVRALDENALLACAADAGEEAQGNADDKGARAAHDEERQRAVDPVDPLRVCAEGHAQQRHGNAQQHRADAYGRRVDAGKAGDERLGAGLAGAGVLHKVKNFRDRGFAEGLRGTNFQNAAHVDTAADDLVALGNIAGKALPRQGAGVQGGIAADDDAVQRDLFAGLHDDDAADGDLIRVDLLELAVLFDVGVIGTDVHQRTDVAAALADGVALEQLADLVEQHNGDTLDVVAALRPNGEEERAERGDSHQEALVKCAAVDDADACLAEDIVADDEVGGHIGQEPPDAGQGEECKRDEHDCRDRDADKHFFLLFVHARFTSLSDFLIRNNRTQRPWPNKRRRILRCAAGRVKARSRSPARPFCRP